MSDPEALRRMREIISADPFARHMGIELVELRPGYSRMSMHITEDMANFHGMTHGAAIFALADAAFAAACNSWGQVSIALEVTITFLSATRPGDRLWAEACEEHQGRRTALYRLTVTDENGQVVASCQALAYRKDNWLVEPD